MTAFTGTESWVAKAIEDEAMSRARTELLNGEGLMVYGLNVDQIRALMIYYQEQTGKEPAEIKT